MPVEVLIDLVGKEAGHKLNALAHNRDPRVVTAGKRRSSIGSQRALGRSQKRPEEIVATLHAIVDRVSARMRSSGRLGRTVVVRFRFDDYTRVTRSRTLVEATADTEPILKASLDLLATMTPSIELRGLTLIGLSVTNLADARSVQLALPLADSSSLDHALDAVRDKFGTGALNRAANLGRDPGFSVPMLPDPIRD